MKLLKRWAVVVGLLLAPMPGVAAPPADLAELFPAGTLAYAEVVNPPELAPQLARLVKGTPLEDSIPLIQRRKEAARTPVEFQQEELAWLGLLASPELLAEFKNLRLAAGVTGFTDGGEIEAAAVVLTGDSPAAGLAARALITMDPTLRKVGEVAGVPIFQHRQPNVTTDNSGVPMIVADKGLTDGPHEATYAYLPGLFVLGTSKAAVSQAITRFKGEPLKGERNPSLAATPLFQQAAKRHRQTGLFVFVNFPEFAAQFHKANGIRGGLGRLEDLLWSGADTDLFAWFKLTANPKAVQSLAGCVTLRDGGLVTRVGIEFDPTQKSPLLDLFSGPGVKAEWLHHARRPAQLSLAVSFPETNRAATVLAFLDALAKAQGELGRLPSEAIAEFEKTSGVALSTTVLGKTRGATVVLPAQQELPKGARVWPLVVLHGEDAAVAADWETLLPKLIGFLAGAETPPQPASESVNGVKVFSLPGSGLPTQAPVHYARSGAAVAIGLDRKVVAAGVVADSAAAITSGPDGVSLPSEPVSGFGTLTLRPLLAALLDQPPVKGPVVPVDRGGNPGTLPNGQPIPAKWVEEGKKAQGEFLAALDSLAGSTLQVRREGSELRLEWYQPKLHNGGLKAVIEAGATWLDKTRYARSANPLDPLGRRGNK